MNRRSFLVTPALGMVCLNSAWVRAQGRVQTLDGALRWLDELQNQSSPYSRGAWTLAAVLEHLAQSIEMSINGFPEPKSALFQSTVGAAAFAVFQWRGKMSHNLSEPIPGAPALTTGDQWRASALRLHQSISQFQSYTGALKPHFAYGALNKADFSQAHVFHMANHQEIE
jgi:hypothetical protein